jgi:ATP-dependent exoDNAse (exonuclease V) beta subunit
VLVDEFQDTSRAQWDLVSLLVRTWGEGAGVVSHEAPLRPSIFVVGDRKQSIYRFRGAEVAVMDEAARFIETLRPGRDPRRWIARSYRALPELLAFVNDLFAAVQQARGREDGFRYDERDRFPVEPASPDFVRGPLIGIAAAEEPEECAEAVADEVLRILHEETVRDRATGVPRAVRPGDIAILFRSRASHREFEQSLERRGLPSYVYKGLGFFDSDEIKDVSALLRFLAEPTSDLRAAALLRSRFVRLSDRALARLAPALSAAIIGPEPLTAGDLDEEDRAILSLARTHLVRWLALVDRIPPADLLDVVLAESAYAYELRGPRRVQARENLKKMRALVRRIQNRGYATLARFADYLDALSTGDEANAVIDALDAVNLMTVHASKGLEFPIVFVVNLAKGSGGPPQPIRVNASTEEGPVSVAVGPYAPETDDDRASELEETKRLLYVAFTRARDRLYLSSALRKGEMKPGPGSLAEVLPPAFLALFPSAARPAAATVDWSGPSGREFHLRVCALPAGREEEAQAVWRPAPSSRGADDFEPISSIPELATVAGIGPNGATDDRIVGSVVHRLLDLGADANEEDVTALAAGMLRMDERGSAVDAAAVARRAAEAYRALRRRPDVAAALAGERLYEVPFSIEEPGTEAVIRGTIDCLVLRPGTVTVIEVKTGGPRPEHTAQLARYVTAARGLFPDASVDGLLIYS